jgi:Sulfotransferase family
MTDEVTARYETDDMLLNFSANTLITDLDPLVVTSPVPRSGTTLLQRLLCSSSNALIYGEKSAQDLEFFLNIYAFKAQEYNYRRAVCQINMEKVLRGEVNDWILDLTPDVNGYLLALQKAAFSGIIYCRDYARQQGRRIWGFKYPGWSPATIKLMRNLMPGSRFIFMLRDLLPCLRSAKAQHMLDTEQELRQFCQKWIDGTAYCQRLQADPLALVVNYEDLIHRPDETLAVISSFSGAEDMDRSVLDHKINFWAGQQFSTQSGDGYIPPADLTEGELRIIEEVTAPFSQLVYD